jgi:hypothetical protein
MRSKVIYRSDGSKECYVNGKHVSEAEWNRLCPNKPINFAAGEMPGMYMDFGDWSNENGGLGRFCPQKASGPKARDGYCRSRNELIGWAKSKGKLVEKE